jgi:hypothetical protein
MADLSLLDWSLLAAALFAISGGAAGSIAIRKRAFGRRNALGVEVFASYASMLLTRSVEAALNALAVLLVVSGIVLAAYVFRLLPF